MYNIALFSTVQGHYRSLKNMTNIKSSCCETTSSSANSIVCTSAVQMKTNSCCARVIGLHISPKTSAEPTPTLFLTPSVYTCSCSVYLFFISSLNSASCSLSTWQTLNTVFHNLRNCLSESELVQRVILFMYTRKSFQRKLTKFLFIALKYTFCILCVTKVCKYVNPYHSLKGGWNSGIIVHN